MTTGSLPCVLLLRHQLFLPSEVFIADQARALRRYIPLLLGRAVLGMPAEGLNYNVPVGATKLQKARYLCLRDPRLLLRGIREHRPSLVHAHFGVEGVYGLELAKALNVPLVSTFHGFDATLKAANLITARKLSWLMYLIYRQSLARRGSLFICVSKFIHDRMLSLGFPEDRTKLHYIGVAAEEFESTSDDAEHPIILHTARLVEKKGTRYLVESFAKIALKHPKALLVVIGDGPLRNGLIELSEQLGISSRIRWFGALPHVEVKKWLARTSVFCLPSCTAESGDAEGLGMALLEAAASGVPILATRHGGIPEAVIEGETGILVPERSTAQLSEALDALLSSPSLRQKMGIRGRLFVREKFDLSRQAGLLEDLYDSTL